MAADRRYISVTNPRVKAAFAASNNVSGLIQEAILFYLDNKSNDYVTRSELNSLLGAVSCSGPITNSNYDREGLQNDIGAVLGLG